MKLGINTFFIMKFGLEAGLKFCQDLGVKAVEVDATESEVTRYCDVDTLVADEGNVAAGLTPTPVTVLKSTPSPHTVHRCRRTSRSPQNIRVNFDRLAP